MNGNSLDTDFGVFQGFPFAINDLNNFQNDDKRIEALFLELSKVGFDSSANYIIYGCEYDATAQTVSAGLVYFGQRVVKVDQFSTTGYANPPGLKLIKTNIESILWGDGQTRDSIWYWYTQGVDYSGAAGEYLLSDLERLTLSRGVTPAANFAISGAHLRVDKFRDRFTISGNIQYTGSGITNVSTKIADLPAGTDPATIHAAIAGKLRSGAAKADGIAIRVEGLEIYADYGELQQNDIITLDGISWSV